MYVFSVLKSLMNYIKITALLFLFLFMSCKQAAHKKTHIHEAEVVKSVSDSVIIDCNYTLTEALQGTKAPDSVTEELELITVKYLSMDGKVHQGQLLTNKQISKDLQEVFDYMLSISFPVERVVPIVKYNWNDDLSMKDNNTYSFCYRNVSFSKHARGMAVDINPFLNPLRWRADYSYRKDKPEGATYNPDVPGTFYPENPVVLKFKEKGFRWGRTFKRNNDDHHFEK